jgi:hypothetical protein
MQMRAVTLGLALVGVIATCLSAPADAEVLCKKRNGVVVVREVCKRKEPQLDPDALGLRGPQGEKGDTGSQGPPGIAGPALVVEDANGAFVGLAEVPDAGFQSNDPLPVVIRVGGLLHRFKVTGDGLALQPSVNQAFGLYYASSDCSGTPLLGVGTGWVMETYLGRNNTILYAAGPAGPHTPNSLSERLVATSQADCVANYGTESGVFFVPPDLCCFPAPGTTGTHAPFATMDTAGAALGLVPPFRVEGP